MKAVEAKTGMNERLKRFWIIGLLVGLCGQQSQAEETPKTNIAGKIAEICMRDTDEEKLKPVTLSDHCFCLADSMIKEFSLLEYMHFEGTARLGTWKSLESIKRIEPEWMSCVESNYD